MILLNLLGRTCSILHSNLDFENVQYNSSVLLLLTLNRLFFTFNYSEKNALMEITHETNTCLKSTVETLEEGTKYFPRQQN